MTTYGKGPYGAGNYGLQLPVGPYLTDTGLGNILAADATAGNNTVADTNVGNVTVSDTEHQEARR